ncbi:MAG: hypothetical protein ACOC3V_05865 [bacterium]
MEYLTSYSIGEEVTVKQNLDIRLYYMSNSPYFKVFTPDMYPYRGQKLKVSNILRDVDGNPKAYHLEGNVYVWTDEMFE